MQKIKHQSLLWLFIPILFLFYSAPGALDFVFHYPDEKYYTDAVLQMIERGDYFTPYKADGSPRFLKPIVTYWLLIASYKIFGVSILSSRIFFWISGALLVCITFFMAKSLSGNHRIAAAAAFITAANPLVLLSASRSIPDILLTLFLTLSAWGFIEILIADKPRKIFYWLAYCGAALAFETKGLPAAAFAVVSILFLLFNPWIKLKFSKLIAPLPIIISILIAFSWFVIMYFVHGSTYFESFFNDQIGERMSSKILQFAGNAALGILNLTAFSIPWILIAFSNPRGLKRYILNTNHTNKSIFGFIAVWIILIILMAGSVFKFYDRYILPVVPLSSVFFAFVITETETRLKIKTFQFIILLNLTFIALGAVYAIFIYPTLLVVTGLILWLVITILIQSRIADSVNPEIKIANSVLLLYFGLFILLYPLLMPNPGRQLVNALTENGISNTDKVYVYGNIRMASNMRIQSKNKLNIITMDHVFSLPDYPTHYLIFDKKQQHLIDLKNYEILPGSKEWIRVPESKFPEFMQTTVLKIKESGTTYLIAKPNYRTNEKP